MGFFFPGIWVSDPFVLPLFEADADKMMFQGVSQYSPSAAQNSGACISVGRDWASGR